MTTVAEAYASRIAQGQLVRDPAQGRVVDNLDRIKRELAASSRSRGLGWLKRSKPDVPRGLYIWGGVGRGKTMLMDLFYGLVPTRVRARRSHFHEFMAEVHDRIGLARKQSPGDPIPIVAARIADEAQVLCFDELHVTDIADAMILGRLFARLFERGVTVIATSNVPPERLYENGLNRNLFLPFVELIETHLEVVELASPTDHRLRRLAGHKLYFTPLGPDADAEMDAVWAELAGPPPHSPMDLIVSGRRLHVPQQADGSARFTFAELCEAPLGSRDYLALARRFHTIFIDRIPVLAPAQRNAARRFINLIDTLYDNRVGLVVSAAAEPTALYTAGDGAELFHRTASRLIEMRSEAYVADRIARLRNREGEQAAEAR